MLGGAKKLEAITKGAEVWNLRKEICGITHMADTGALRASFTLLFLFSSRRALRSYTLVSEFECSDGFGV